jgi:Tfp pilus assembly PilM family ATPase
MSLFENHAGFNLTTRKLQLVEVINNDKNFYLENVDEVLLEKEISLDFSESEIVNILQNSFNKTIQKKKLQSKNISFALSHEYFKICQIPYENTLLAKDLLEYLKFEFGVLFPTSAPEEYIIRHHEINNEGLLNNKTAILIAVNKKILNVLHLFCKSNLLKLKSVDNIHVASNSFILLEQTGSRKEMVGSILADGNYLSYILLDEKKPVYFKTKKIVDNSDLSGEIKKELKDLEKLNLNVEDIYRWYIGGDLANDDFITDIKDKINITLFRYNPLDKIKISPHIYENDFFIEKYFAFTAPAGMALRII